MMSRSKNLLLAILALCTVVSVGYAETSSVWSGSLQSAGDDVVWTSDAPVRLGYGTYFANFYVSNFQTAMAPVGQTPVEGPFPLKQDISSAGLYDSAQFEIGNVVYDTNEMDFDLVVNIDEDGYANVNLTNVAFPELFDGTLQISSLSFDFSLEVTPVQKLWSDGFNTYTAGQLLGDTDAWTTGWEIPDFSAIDSALQGSRTAKVNTGKVLFSDNYWGGFPDSWKEAVKTAIPDGVESHSFNGVPVNDYIVTVKAYTRNVGSLYKSNYYLLSRVGDVNDISLEVGWGPYSEKFYALLFDKTGNGFKDSQNPDAIAQQYVADIDVSQPVILTMRVKGTEVIGIAEHNGGKAVLRYETTVDAGEPGFGGEWKWGYMDALWDDFAVYAVTANEPQQCGDDGTVFLKGDINKDCAVDIVDLKAMAANWLVQY